MTNDCAGALFSRFVLDGTIFFEREMTLLRYNLNIDFTDQELDSLICAGIKTVQSFIMGDASAISQSTSIPAKKIRINQDKLMGSLKSPIFNINSFEKLHSSKKFIIQTQCPNLDKLLGGGIMTGEITELNGISGTGKTQFAFHMSFTLALKGKEVLFIDTDGSFSSERLYIMHSSAGIKENLETIIRRIHVYRIFNFYKLMKFFDILISDLTSPQGFYRNVNLVILDSFAGSFVELVEYRRQIKRWSALLEIMSSYNNALQTIVTVRPDIAVMFSDRQKTISFIRRNNCRLVLKFENNEDGTRQITCEKSERLPMASSTSVNLENSGFTDAFNKTMLDITNKINSTTNGRSTDDGSNSNRVNDNFKLN